MSFSETFRINVVVIQVLIVRYANVYLALRLYLSRGLYFILSGGLIRPPVISDRLG